MATLVLTAAIPVLFPGLSGWGLFAATLAATAVGTFIDSRLFAQSSNTTGPRLTEISLTNSTEGAAIKRLYGRSRLGGTMIWCTNFKEVETEEEVGGKGGGSQTVTNFTYFVSFAIAFCEGIECTQLGRVWMDGKEVDISQYEWRFYEGTDTQMPDSLIQQIEGSDKVPGFRGVTYLVFELLPLEDFGNRIPQVTAEITRPIPVADPDHMENILQGISLIPSSGEFVYSNVVTTKTGNGLGNSSAENAHFYKDVADAEVSLDQMGCALPALQTVNLVVSWFGNDLRAGNCLIKPMVEVQNKTTQPASWKVNGVVRSAAVTVSKDGEDRPIYGGTPSDHSIVEMIVELKSRGYKVCFYPFTLMDVPSGNTLPNPYSANGATNGQPAFPWRGRITCHPAREFTGTVDKTATAASQIATFFGNAEVSDFSVVGTTVSWTGGTDWGMRRMVLHYALLCEAAGGVDYFCVGTEMTELTRVRSTATSTPTFPAVDEYVDLINDVKAIVGPGCEVGYAANWDEYHSHRPTDGSNDIFFNMDPIWAVADFIGIDNYAPMSDWRDGALHLDYDAVNGPRKIYDRNYLASNIEGGEFYDWFYLNQADRDSQTRTAIVDGAEGKHWVFRQKDFRNWWNNLHYNRPGGVAGTLLISGEPADNYIVANGIETPDFSVDDLGNPATRVEFPSGGGPGTFYRQTSFNVISGKRYTIRIRVKINSGGSQTFTLGFVGAGSSNTNVTATSIWQEFEYSFVSNATTTVIVYPIDNRGLNNATDLLISLGNVWESGSSPTGWTAESKRIIFTEFGCPAIDKGTNQPNVFFDPKSSESFFPYYSNGQRDDVIQRTYIEVFVKYWRDNGGTMVAQGDIWAWTWDARPYPQFPLNSVAWSDGGNWTLGHWLNGRAGAITLGALVTEFMSLVGLENDVDVSGLVGQNTIVPGYIVDNIMSPREMMTPLFQAFLFDGYESGGEIKFSLRLDTKFEALALDDFVSDKNNMGGYSITRQQESELLASVSVDFVDGENAYQAGSVPGTKQVGETANVAKVQFPIVLDQKYARALADIIVQESWAVRENGELLLPPSFMRYDPGDGLTFTVNQRDLAVRIIGVENGMFQKIDFMSHEPSIYGGMAFAGRPPVITPPNVFGSSVVLFMDIPLLTGSEPAPWAPRLAAYQSPFPPAVNVYIEDDVTSALTLINQVTSRSQIAVTLTALEPGTPWIIDEEATIRVQVSDPSYQPTSNSETAILAGANAIALENDNGFWEIIQFTTATLVSGTTYDLSGLLRGQLGTEADMADAAIGSRVAFINTAILLPLGINIGQKTLTFTYRYGPSPNATSHHTYSEETLTFRSVALMPYAPTELSCQRTNVDGRLLFGWIRRTRFNGDDWETEDVPLNEEFEKYELEICNSGGTVLRTITELATPEYLYSAADQVTDFGSVQTSVRIRVYQISSQIGRGHAADETVSF